MQHDISPPSGPPSAAMARLFAHRRAFSTSVLNQAVSSGTNFALGFFLVRVLSASAFGTYGIGLAACYLYSGVGNALFLTQMVVHTPDRPESDRVPYAARVLSVVVVFGGSTLLVCSVGAAVAIVFVPQTRSHASLVLSVGLASVAFLMKDFFVRQAYTARAEIRALFVNCSVAIFVAVSLTALHATGVELNATRAFLVFASAQTAGALAGVALAALPVRSVSRADVLQTLSSCWTHGSWAIGGVLVSWAQSQAYTYVTALFAGPAAVGRANAARLLVSPFLFLVPAVNQVTMPRLADMRASDPQRTVRTGRLITMVLIGVAGIYSTLLLLGSEAVVPVVLGPRYSGMRPIVGAWCAVVLSMLLRDGASVLLQTMKQFRTLAMSNALSAAVSIGCVVWFMNAFGIPGAVAGSAAGDLVLAALLWRAVRRERATIG